MTRDEVIQAQQREIFTTLLKQKDQTQMKTMFEALISPKKLK